jgi:O-methyltransferase involved in polyketide biosynthesis
MCIELGAGLSTRFHRLSDTADWPRFHWVEVDLPQVTALKAGVLPTIDNYRLVSADILSDDWLNLSGWQPEQPLLVLLEAVAPELKGNSLLHLIKCLRQRVGAAELEIILDDRRPRLWQHWLKQLATYLGAQFRVPITTYCAELEQQEFQITRQKSLLGNTFVGMVINYQGL